MEDPNTNSHQVWYYLWSFIRLSDAIVCHPLFKSVPPCMPLDKLYLMPAVIDPFDGLNKFLDVKTVEYYQAAFNRLAYDVVGKRLDFRVRPIIAQFARFDPSKGKLLPL